MDRRVRRSRQVKDPENFNGRIAKETGIAYEDAAMFDFDRFV